MIVGPGEAPCHIEQPVSRRIADAAAHRTERQHRLAVTRRAQDRRVEVGEAPDRQPVEIWKGRKRGVGFHAEHQAIGEHVIIAALKSHQEASRLGEAIDWQGQVDRARGRRQPGLRRVGGPVRVSAGIAHMAADIEAGPVVEAGDRRRFDRHRIDNREIRCMTIRHREEVCRRDADEANQNCFDVFAHSRRPTSASITGVTSHVPIRPF